MAEKQITSVLSWTIWSPLRFAAMSFLLIFSGIFISQLIINATDATIATTQLLSVTIPTLATFLCIILMIRKLPHAPINKNSFIALHNIQTIILSAAYFIVSYFVLGNAKIIIFRMLSIQSQSPYLFTIIASTSSLFLLYITGVLVSNIYAKFCRIRAFKIPTWKILLTIPFGFSALWTPGYLMDTSTPKDTTVLPKTQWYKRITNFITSSTRNNILSFIFITIISALFFGPIPVLLTFSLTLIYGIWTLHVGNKNFLSNGIKRYSNTMIIINLTLLIALSLFNTFAQPTQQNVQVNISDTSMTLPKE